MRLKEFMSGSAKADAKIETQISQFEAFFRKNGITLQRYGGAGAIYVNPDNNREKLSIFRVNKSDKFIGLSAGARKGDSGDISLIHVWEKFREPVSPDFGIFLPMNAKVPEYGDLLISAIQRPRPGVFEVGDNLREMAVRTSAMDFVKMAQEWVAENPDKDASQLTVDDLKDIALKNEVKIPGEIRDFTGEYKVKGSRYWDLSRSTEDPEELERKNAAAKAAGGEYDPDPDFGDEEDDDLRNDLLNLKRSGNVIGKLAGKKKLIIQSWKKVGGQNRFYTIPNSEQYIQALNNIIERHSKVLDQDPNAKKKSLKEKFAQLKLFLKAIVSGKTETYHSIIVTGAPGIGKSYTVKEVLREEGKQEGRDFVETSGRITSVKLFERFFVSHNKILLFDDCDSVWGNEDTANMLKAALQTGDGVRSITWDKAGGGEDTAAMTFKEREEALARTRLFYDDPMQWAMIKMREEFPDVLFIDGSYEENGDDTDDQLFSGHVVYTDNLALNPFDKKEDHNEYVHYQSFYNKEIKGPLRNRSIPLPNKIHFDGRVIFISNLDRKDLDPAVVSRSLVYHMDVSSLDAVGFVKEEIVSKMKHNSVNYDERMEIINYIEELYTIGRAIIPFSIREFQGALDLYAMDPNDWKSNIDEKFAGLV